MNLAQLYYFRTLAKYEHYGKAAESLYITQPSLSNSIKNLEKETRTTVFYEAPHRLVRTLKTLQETLGNRRISICRELTKKHETVFATTIEDALVYYDVQEPKGECVMVIEGKSREEIRNEEKARWEEMSIEEHMELYLGQGMDKKSAMKQVAKDRGVGKRDIYQALL